MAESTHAVSTPTQQTSTVDTDASTARFMLPADGFALAGLFEGVPDARVECESTFATPNDHVLLSIQTDENKHTVDAALQSDSSVGAVECFGERADGWTYRVRWGDHPRQLIQQLVATDVTLLSVVGQGGHWKFRLLAPDRDGISRAHDIMNELDCESDCLSISTFGGSTDSRRSELTEGQQEALEESFEAGYYNIPRDVTADEVADDIGISHQALSERLRRAYRHLVEAEFITDNQKHPKQDTQ
jgi:predicted DNA binding protein